MAAGPTHIHLITPTYCRPAYPEIIIMANESRAFSIANAIFHDSRVLPAVEKVKRGSHPPHQKPIDLDMKLLISKAKMLKPIPRTLSLKELPLNRCLTKDYDI